MVHGHEVAMVTASPPWGAIPAVDAGDREVLTAWSRSRQPRLARRAWIVLEESAGVKERRLAEATPLSSARVQALVAGYRQHGLLGLVDAPRSGRPRTVLAQALPLDPAPGVPPHRDTVWRLAREQGINIDRQRRRHVAWPAVADGPWAGVHGVAAGPNVTAVFAGPPRKDLRHVGTWLYPRFDALSPASVLGESFDWTVALEALTNSGACPDKPRAVQERRGLLLDRLMRQMRDLPVMEVLVGGDPLNAEFLSWLAALRAIESGLGKRGPRLRVRGAACFTTWHDLLCEVLVDSSARSQAGRAEDERVSSLLWLSNTHFWWRRGGS